MAQIELDIQVNDTPIERLINAVEQLTESLTTSKKASKEVNDEIVNGSEKAAKSVKEVNKETRLQSTIMGSLGNNAKTTLQGMTQGWKGATTATKGFGLALKATGIGLLVAMVVPIIDVFKQFIGQLDIVQMYLEMVGKVLSIVSDAINKLTRAIFKNRAATDDLISTTKVLNDERNNAFKLNESNLKDELDLLKAQGANTEQIRAVEMRLAIERAEYAQANLKSNQEEVSFLASQTKLSKAQKERLEELKKQTLELTLAAESSTKQIDILIANQQTQRNIEIKAIEAQTNEDKKAARDAAKAKTDAHKQYVNDRLVANRLLEDLEVQQMENNIDKEIKLNQIKYERLIEDTKNNEKLTQTEKLSIIDHYENLRSEKEKEINDNKLIEDEAKARINANKILELELQLDEQRINRLEEFSSEKQERELELLSNQYQFSLEALQHSLDNELITQKEFELQKILLKESTEEFITATNKKYSDERIRIEKEEAEKKKGFQVAVAQAGVSAASSLLGSMSELAEEGSKEAKGLAIAQVTVDTIMGGIAAMSQSIAQLGPIAGPIVGGVLAAGIAASGASAIQKIKSTKKDSSGGGSAPRVNVAVPSSSSSSSQPNMDLTSVNNNVNSSDSNNGQNGGDNTIRAVVSWTDIDAVSKADNQLRNQMSL